MKGFKNTTKMVSGHGEAKDCFAGGGIVPPMAGGAGPKMSGGPRPIMPRPRVMPNERMASMKNVKLAAGGPYNGGGEGNTLDQNNRPYSEIEKQHPRNVVRPGYSKGGKKAHKPKFAKHANGGKIPPGLGAKPGKNLAFMSKPMFGKE